MTRLLFVTGHADVAGWVDLDEHAAERPVTGWLDWLRWRAATALHNVTSDHAGDGRLHVVTGIVWPFRVVESPAWRPAMKAGLDVGWLLLDPPWRTVRGRLDARSADWSVADRRELRRYNRDLRRTLRDQVAAMRNGRCTASTDPAELVTCGTATW